MKSDINNLIKEIQQSVDKDVWALEGIEVDDNMITFNLNNRHTNNHFNLKMKMNIKTGNNKSSCLNNFAIFFLGIVFVFVIIGFIIFNIDTSYKIRPS